MPTFSSEFKAKKEGEKGTLTLRLSLLLERVLFLNIDIRLGHYAWEKLGLESIGSCDPGTR